MTLQPSRGSCQAAAVGLLVFCLLTVRFSPNWFIYHREYRSAVAGAATDAKRTAAQKAYGDTFSTKRGVEVARQVADPSAEISDLRHAIVRWRLLMPAVGHVLRLPVWAVLGLAQVGCLILIVVLVTLIFRRSDGSRRSLFEAACFGVVAGASAPFVTSMGWLGYYDSWLAIGLIAVAFARPPGWIWLACLLTPWVDERFVLGLPLALCVRWLHFEPTGKNAFGWIRREVMVPCVLVSAFAIIRLQLGGSGASQTVGEYFNTFIFGRKVELTRLLHGTAEGLRVGWVGVLLAVIGNRQTSDGAGSLRAGLLAVLSVVAVLVGLYSAMDLSRSMVVLISVVPLGWLLATRAAWWKKYYVAPVLAVTALALPARHVMSHRVIPVDDFLSCPYDVAVAESNLGVAYLHGDGVPQDSVEAVKWFRRAAERGNAVGQSNLGVMYAHGDGAPKDAAVAVQWYRRAAEQGDAVAQFNLGGMYYEGEGVPKDIAEAVRWYRRAAERGQPAAIFNLGVAYLNGEGVPKNQIEALALITLAAESGDGSAIASRETVERQVGEEGARAARKRSGELARQFKL